MAISYRVQPYDEEVEAAYARLFPDAEAQGEAAPATRAWRFLGNPHGPGWFATARDPEGGDAIVGMIGLIAGRLRVGAERVPALQAVDTIVDPACRGRNIFVGLGKAAHGGTDVHGAKVIWGFPNANAARGWFGRLGWRNFGMIPFLIKPLRSGYFLRRLVPALGRLDLPLSRRRRTLGPTHREISRFDAQASALWEAFAAGVGCAVDRDADWLNWRLVDRPGAPYRSVGCFDEAGRLRALVSTCLVGKHGGRIAYVMEALSAPEDARRLARLVRGEIGRRAAEGADVALGWCPAAAPNRRAYKKAGFLPLPARLRPIALHFGARPLVEGLPPAPGEGDAWYISYLDSDTV